MTSWVRVGSLHYSDKLGHVHVVINCPFSVAQMCTREDKLAHTLRAPCIDDVMSFNSLTNEWFTIFHQHLIPHKFLQKSEINPPPLDTWRNLWMPTQKTCANVSLDCAKQSLKRVLLHPSIHLFLVFIYILFILHYRCKQYLRKLYPPPIFFF